MQTLMSAAGHGPFFNVALTVPWTLSEIGNRMKMALVRLRYLTLVCLRPHLMYAGGADHKRTWHGLVPVVTVSQQRLKPGPHAEHLLIAKAFRSNLMTVAPEVEQRGPSTSGLTTPGLFKLLLTGGLGTTTQLRALANRARGQREWSRRDVPLRLGPRSQHGDQGSPT